MFIAYHLIITGYGHWLPNDPRGSSSREVHVPRIDALGEHHYGRKNVPPSAREVREFRARAQDALHFPSLWWDSAERQALADAFGEATAGHGLTCYACAVLSNHVHLLFRKHGMKAEGILAAVRGNAKARLGFDGTRFAGHPVFSADPCRHYKSTPGEVAETVQYIHDNYAKHNLAPVDAAWVVPYDGWPRAGEILL